MAKAESGRLLFPSPKYRENTNVHDCNPSYSHDVPQCNSSHGHDEFSYEHEHPVQHQPGGTVFRPLSTVLQPTILDLLWR